MRITESNNAQFIENDQFSGSKKLCKVDIIETCGESFSPIESPQVGVPLTVLPLFNTKRQHINIQKPQNEHIVDEPIENE